MSQANKEIVGRWFTEYWQKGNVAIVDELGAEDLVFSYLCMESCTAASRLKKC